jgi:hypothetical protein
MALRCRAQHARHGAWMHSELLCNAPRVPSRRLTRQGARHCALVLGLALARACFGLYTGYNGTAVCRLAIHALKPAKESAVHGAGSGVPPRCPAGWARGGGGGGGVGLSGMTLPETGLVGVGAQGWMGAVSPGPAPPTGL